MPLPRSRLTGAAFLLAALLAARPALAQQCDTVVSRTSLAAFAGEPIREVVIRPETPRPLPGSLRLLGRLHVGTREATLRRHLLFAAGEPLDTQAVAESLRRLRAERYLADVWIVGRRCADAPGVALTLHSRDAWTARPRAHLGSQGALEAGFEERNLLGTGRTVSVGLESRDGRLGAGLWLEDPWVLDGRLAGRLGFARFSDGQDAVLRLATPERSLFDAVSFELRAGLSERIATPLAADTFRRADASVLGRWKVHETEQRVVSLLVGAEWVHTRLRAAAGQPLLGPPAVARSYAALDLGAALRSAAYDTLSWLVAPGGIVDVPLGLEGEVLVGLGADRAAARPVVHLDGWAGRVWLPRRDLLLSADAWASGYLGDDRLDATTLRLALAAYRPDGGGLWTARLAAERLVNPDPDLRQLASYDPLRTLMPSGARLAETAVTASLERQLPLMRLSRSWTLGGALFAASSLRWEAAGPDLERAVHADVVGVGLRSLPRRAGRGTIRLDVGFPVFTSSAVPRRPYVSFSVAPWWAEARQRDGRRQP